MHTAGWAFAWGFWHRHRWLWTVTLLYLLALVLLVNALPAGALDPKVVGELVIPLACVLPVVAGIFSYGDQGDLLTRESNYPRRAFTLPLPTRALVGWPMALGAATIAGLWLAIGGLVLRPAGLPVAVLWPAVFGAALLAWTQALAWLPYPLTVLRVLVMLPALSVLIAAAIVGIAFDVPASVLLTASACLIPAAYLVAVAGVTRARRGDTPMRYWLMQRRAATRGDAAAPFPSPWHALAWLEWRGNVYLLPMLAMFVLLIMPLIYLLTNDETLPMLIPGLAAYPLMLAFAAGGSLGNCHAWARQQPAIPAFLATRPVTNRALLAVKLQGTVLTTLAIWLLLALGLAVTLPFCRGGTLLANGMRALFETQGEVRGVATLLAIALGLLIVTWKWTVDHLWIGLSGRYWITLIGCIVGPGLVCGVALALTALLSPSAEHWHRSVFAYLIAAALALKLLAGGFVASQLLRRGVITSARIVQFATVWIVAAAAIGAVSLWLVPVEDYSPLAIGGVAVIVMLPMARLGLAPLALEWNRHR